MAKRAVGTAENEVRKCSRKRGPWSRVRSENEPSDVSLKLGARGHINVAFGPGVGSSDSKLREVQIYVSGQEYGGSDKSSNGHRYDSIPIANGVINAGCSCQPIHYVPAEHDKFFEVACFVIVCTSSLRHVYFNMIHYFE